MRLGGGVVGGAERDVNLDGRACGLELGEGEGHSALLAGGAEAARSRGSFSSSAAGSNVANPRQRATVPRVTPFRAHQDGQATPLIVTAVGSCHHLYSTFGRTGVPSAGVLAAPQADAASPVLQTLQVNRCVLSALQAVPFTQGFEAVQPGARQDPSGQTAETGLEIHFAVVRRRAGNGVPHTAPGPPQNVPFVLVAPPHVLSIEPVLVHQCCASMGAQPKPAPDIMPNHGP